MDPHEKKTRRPILKPAAFSLTILLALACSTTNGRGARREGNVVAVVDVTVVPMDSERSLPHHTVLMRDGVISEVAPGVSTVVETPEEAIFTRAELDSVRVQRSRDHRARNHAR
jgi:hypothetical protein